MDPIEILKELQAARERAEYAVNILSARYDDSQTSAVCSAHRLRFFDAMESASKAAHDIDLLINDFIKAQGK